HRATIINSAHRANATQTTQPQGENLAVCPYLLRSSGRSVGCHAGTPAGRAWLHHRRTRQAIRCQCKWGRVVLEYRSGRSPNHAHTARPGTPVPGLDRARTPFGRPSWHTIVTNV